MRKLKPMNLRQWGALAVSIIVLGGLLIACGDEGQRRSTEESTTPVTKTQAQPNTPQSLKTNEEIDEQPSDVYYEIFVRSFYDSDGDGIGDLKGVIEKLDYLNDGNSETGDDLGVTGIWLMPVQPSPSYHGYDVTDYRSIHPDYGTIEDFRTLTVEAHKRGIKVIMDLVVNHTSSEHPWFKEAADDKNSEKRDWYVWAEDQGREATGSSAAGSGNPWHEANGAHYMGTFWGGMPDLNFDHPKVREEMKDIGKFWLEQGADGFRLDAAKHIFEDLTSDKSEATTAKNTAWWEEFRAGMNEVKPDVYLVGEVWENSASSIAPYLNNAFNSGFNFGLGESIIGAVHSGKDNNLAFTLERTYSLFGSVSGGAFTDAVFLTNHDQNRVMTQLGTNMDQAKMAAAILLTMPGNPFIYYGEEIGMQGGKPDEQIREPMIWSNEGSVTGQTTWEPLKYNKGERTRGVEQQLRDPHSLLSRYRTLIRWRHEIPALHEGTIQQYTSGNGEVMAYLRLTKEQQALVVHNLSGGEATVDLAAKSGQQSFTVLSKATSDKTVLKGSVLTLPAYATAVLE